MSPLTAPMNHLLPAHKMQPLKLRSLLFALLSLPALAIAGGIRFSGNSAVSTPSLNEVEVRLRESGGRLSPDAGGRAYRLAELETSQLSAEAVNEIVRAISAHYQAQGILATRAQVSRNAFATAQSGGDLVIEIVEGRISEVRVSPAEGSELSDRTRERVLAASPVRVGGAIDGSALEASLAALNRFSASQVQPVLFSAPEGLVLEYRVKPSAPWSFGYTVDNFGSERTGEVRHSVDVSFTGVAMADDRISLSGILTSGSGSQYLRGEYFAPLGKSLQHRLKVSLYHAAYNADDIGIASIEFEGESNGAILAYETTLWSGAGRFLDLSLGAHYLEASQDQSSLGGTKAESGFFLPFIDLKLSQQGAKVSWVGGVRLEANQPGIGGTADETLGGELERLGRYFPSENFVIGRLYGGLRVFVDQDRVHELLANGAYVGSVGGDRLPAPFLNVVGGHNTVRGYRVAAISGDNSAYAQLEYRFHALRLIEQASEWDVALSAFFDLGAVANEDRIEEYEFDDTISSFGVGLHVTFRDQFRASVEYAQASDDITTPYESIEAGDSEVYLKGSFQF